MARPFAHPRERRAPNPESKFESAISLVNQIDKELQHIARQPDRDGAFAAQAINGGSSRIVLDHAVEESADREPTSQEKAAFPGVLVEAFYSQNRKDLESLA
ncbi:hypothetical protein K4K49_010507 [Colletotrichum sp. SAR 10_70]|nr:hypothetical protein K4K50_010444 [Colletotrichum sp. SAR 10_71]KAI8152952.1 hypothetical protein K4K49_010507 [Colletotrichum sp. SAR 10_70]